MKDIIAYVHRTIRKPDRSIYVPSMLARCGGGAGHAPFFCSPRASFACLTLAMPFLSRSRCACRPLVRFTDKLPLDAVLSEEMIIQVRRNAVAQR